MVKYNTAKYNIGDLVTIISIEHSGANHVMEDMIGRSFPIQGIPDHASCIINEFFWSTKDIEKFKPINKQKKHAEKFDINNLITESKQL